MIGQEGQRTGTGTMRRVSDTYREISRRKLVVVYPNGYGLVRFLMQIQVLGEKFSGPFHYFGLSSNVPSDIRIPPIADLQMGTLLDVGYRPLINHRLLSPVQWGPRIEAREVSSESDDRIRMVHFRMDQPCLDGQVIDYAWEWGFPRLYDTEPGVEDTSSYKCLQAADEFVFELRFVHPRAGREVRFAQPPRMEALHAATDEAFTLAVKGKQELDYISFIWDLGSVSENDQYVVRWRNEALQMGTGAGT